MVDFRSQNLGGFSLQVPKDRIVVERLDPVEESKGGIVLPGKKPRWEGVVVAIGPGVVTKKGVRVPVDLEVGDQVIFEPNEGRNVSLKGTTYLFITEQDVLGVIVPE